MIALASDCLIPIGGRYCERFGAAIMSAVRKDVFARWIVTRPAECTRTLIQPRDFLLDFKRDMGVAVGVRLKGCYDIFLHGRF